MRSPSAVAEELAQAWVSRVYLAEIFRVEGRLGDVVERTGRTWNREWGPWLMPILGRLPGFLSFWPGRGLYWGSFALVLVGFVRCCSIVCGFGWSLYGIGGGLV